MTYSTYQEAAEFLTKLREKYTSAGDMVFRTAVLSLFRDGARNAKQTAKNARDLYNHLDKNGCRPSDADLTLGILDCAAEMENVPYDSLMVYMVTENLAFIPFTSGQRKDTPLPYKRLRKITDNLLSGIAEDYNNISGSDHLQRLKNDGLTEAEIRYFGYEYLLDLEEETENDEG